VLDRADAGLDVTRVCRHRMKDGEVVMVEVASGMTAWRGQPAILMTVTNISARYTALAQVRREHAALERQFREQTAQLEASRQEVNELTYALSNDLQSPLHVIDGFARRLTADCDALLDVPGRRYVQRIQASVGHMSRMLDDLRRLLSVSRATLTLERVDLSALCQALGEPLRQKYPEGRVELDIEPGLSCWGDVPLLTVAMAALLDNAWKFTARKPQAWVRVGLASSREGGPPVLCVADNGAGFDEAYAHRLFGNFQRLHSSAEFPGVGLGLAIVKRIVTRHGGRVWAESAASAGASFFLSLPPAPD
jgi:light-regulated signal transduction histidine kinase (bacteriophytochrome)